MSETTKSEGPIVVYGATGYTGRLITAELASSGMEFELSGRNGAKLDSLASELGIEVPLHAIATDEGDALRELFSRASAVIACAGPFYQHGEPILAAATDAGTPYLDTTGEQPFIRKALEEYGPRAAEKGSAVMSGMGFDYVPGDLLAALTAEGMGPLERIRLGYATKFQPTRGTMLSALDMIKGGDLEWRDGGYRPAPQSIAREKFDFGGGIGEKPMTRYPAGEHITVPRHIETRRVDTSLSADSMAPGPLARLAPLIARPAGLAMRTRLKGLTGKIVERLPEGAGPEARAAATWIVGCEAIGTDGRVRRGTVSGRDVYGLTAALLVKGARVASEGGLRGTGGLAPAQAFDPATFLEGFERFGVTWRVDPAE